MKRFTFLLSGLICIIAFLNSCTNDFDLVDQWQDIPIAYGLLNVNDTAQYIKIEKAFLDTETSALVLAQEPDSLYYQNLSVELQELGNNGVVDFSFPLMLVDANLEGYIKPEGIFASSPNYVYKTDGILDPERDYRLVIINGETDRTVTAETGIIGDFEIFRPQSAITNPNFKVNWEIGNEVEFKWSASDDSGNQNAAFYDVVLYINYFEQEKNNPASRIEKTLEWRIAEGIVPPTTTGNSRTLAFDGIVFYQYLSQNLEPLGFDFCRELNDMDFVIYAGGEDLYNYIRTDLANTGITGTQPLPDYTNLSEGRGVFSTRYDNVVDSVQINNDVREQLIINELTADLNFLEPGDACN